MVEDTGSNQQNKERAAEIFQNIFSEIYLGSCNNPLDLDLIKTEIEGQMKIQFDEAMTWNFEQCFNDADTDNVSEDRIILIFTLLELLDEIADEGADTRVPD